MDYSKATAVTFTGTKSSKTGEYGKDLNSCGMSMTFGTPSGTNEAEIKGFRDAFCKSMNDFAEDFNGSCASKMIEGVKAPEDPALTAAKAYPTPEDVKSVLSGAGPTMGTLTPPELNFIATLYNGDPKAKEAAKTILGAGVKADVKMTVETAQSQPAAPAQGYGTQNYAMMKAPAFIKKGSHPAKGDYYGELSEHELQFICTANRGSQEEKAAARWCLDHQTFKDMYKTYRARTGHDM